MRILATASGLQLSLRFFLRPGSENKEAGTFLAGALSCVKVQGMNLLPRVLSFGTWVADTALVLQMPIHCIELVLLSC